MSFHKSMLGRVDEPGPGSVENRTITNPLGFVIQPSEKTLAEYIRRKNQDEVFTSVAQEEQAAPATAPNLACKSVQKRLAAQWGYVPARTTHTITWDARGVRSLDGVPDDAATSVAELVEALKAVLTEVMEDSTPARKAARILLSSYQEKK